MSIPRLRRPLPMPDFPSDLPPHDLEYRVHELERTVVLMGAQILQLRRDRQLQAEAMADLRNALARVPA